MEFLERPSWLRLIFIVLYGILYSVKICEMEISMYVLDTNAFYYAAEISEFTYSREKLQKFIRNHETVISTTSLFEFLVRHKDKIDIVQKGGEYLQKNNIKIASNVINPLPEHFVYDLANISQESLDVLCAEILENKIDVESRFTSILFDMCLLSGYYFTALSDGNEPCEYCFRALESVCRMFTPIVLDVFKELYTEGYATDDCENYIRGCFYNLLAFMLEKGIPFIEKAKAVKSEEEFRDADYWIPSEEYSHLTEQLSHRFQRQRSTEFLHRLSVIYWKHNNDAELRKHIARLRAIFDKKVAFPALQDYFYDTMVKILVCGGALYKNDLLDAIILCNTQNQHQLITFDGGVIERMRKREHENDVYKKSLITIKYLQEL